MILKQVIYYPETNSVEASWEYPFKCHSYSDVQMDMLRADLGDDAPQYESLIAEVLAGQQPPQPPTEEHVCQACTDYYGGKLDAGFVYLGVTYQINGEAQDNIGKRATYAGWSTQDPITFPWVEPYSLGWWDISNVWHAMTANEFMLFAKAVSDYVSACAACFRNHKNAITAENCATYDYTTGWPVNP